jgi:hypothetical protein
MGVTMLSARQHLVKIVVGGALGVALLVGWTAVSLTGEPTPGTAPTPAAEAEQPSGQIQDQTVSLTQAVHFTDAEGQDVVVGPGSYRVEAEGTNRIRLVPVETGESVVIEATSLTHQQTVERPVPVAVPDPQQPDVLYLALYLPDGQGVGAIGTYSGVKPRGVSNMNTVLFMKIAPLQTMQFTATAVAPSVVIYEHPNFGGQSQTLGVGGHILSDFNDMASSIQVPAGLVALLYEDIDAGGGYGLSVDLLEDRPNLSQVNFNDKLSYVCVFSRTDPQGFIWARASVQNGQFVAGHWERQRVGGTPVNTTAVVAPPLPPHPANAPPASCGGGPIVREHQGQPQQQLPPPGQSPGFGATPNPGLYESKLAKFHMLALLTEPFQFREGQEKLDSFWLVYECRIETGPCTPRHDVINVGWTIISPKPELNFNRNYGLNVNNQVLYGAVNSVCEGGIIEAYPRASCLFGRAFGGVVGAQGFFTVILSLKSVDGRPDMNDPDTVVQDFTVVMSQPRPFLQMGGPRVRDHR